MGGCLFVVRNLLFLWGEGGRGKEGREGGERRGEKG